MKKVLALALATVVAAGSLAVVPADAYTDYGLGSNKIGKVGSKTKRLYNMILKHVVPRTEKQCKKYQRNIKSSQKL